MLFVNAVWEREVARRAHVAAAARLNERVSCLTLTLYAVRADKRTISHSPCKNEKKAEPEKWSPASRINVESGRFARSSVKAVALLSNPPPCPSRALILL